MRIEIPPKSPKGVLILVGSVEFMSSTNNVFRGGGLNWFISRVTDSGVTLIGVTLFVVVFIWEVLVEICAWNHVFSSKHCSS